MSSTPLVAAVAGGYGGLQWLGRTYGSTWSERRRSLPGDGLDRLFVWPNDRRWGNERGLDDLLIRQHDPRPRVVGVRVPDLDLFALRALAHQPLHRLARISDDPAGACRRGERATVVALARLELSEVGLRPPG